MSNPAWQKTVEKKKGGKGRAESASRSLAEPEIGSQKTIYAQAEALAEEKERKKQERENPKPKEAEAASASAKQKPAKKQQSKAADSKAKGATFAERLQALDLDQLDVVWTEAKEQFSENKLEWVKALADHLIQLVDDLPVETRGDSPLCHLSIDAKTKAVTLLAEAAEALPEMLEHCITESIAIIKKKPSAGLNFVIQVLLVCDASMKPVHIVGNACILLRNKLKDTLVKCPVEVAQGLSRVLLQVVQYAPHTALLAWKTLMLPVVWGETTPAAKDAALEALKPFVATTAQELDQMLKRVIEGLRVLSPLSFHGAVFAPREFSAFLFLTFGTNEMVSDSQRAVLAGAAPLARELMLRHRVHLACLPFFLNWALRVRRDGRLYSEVVRFTVRSLLIDPAGYKVVLDRLPTAAKAKEQAIGLEEALVSVNSIAIALSEGWPCSNIDALSQFLKELDAKVKALLKEPQVVADLGEHSKTAQELTANSKALAAQLQPVDDSAWLLWMALIVAVAVFVVLLAHLGCQKTTPLLLPNEICTKLEDWGFLTGVDKFYEFATPAVPYIERAVNAVQPYATVVMEFSQPYLAMLGELAHSAADAAKPYVNAAADQLKKLRS